MLLDKRWNKQQHSLFKTIRLVFFSGGRIWELVANQEHEFQSVASPQQRQQASRLHLVWFTNPETAGDISHLLGRLSLAGKINPVPSAQPPALQETQKLELAPGFLTSLITRELDSIFSPTPPSYHLSSEAERLERTNVHPQNTMREGDKFLAWLFSSRHRPKSIVPGSKIR